MIFTKDISHLGLSSFDEYYRAAVEEFKSVAVRQVEFKCWGSQVKVVRGSDPQELSRKAWAESPANPDNQGLNHD